MNKISFQSAFKIIHRDGLFSRLYPELDEQTQIKLHKAMSALDTAQPHITEKLNQVSLFQSALIMGLSVRALFIAAVTKLFKSLTAFLIAALTAITLLVCILAPVLIPKSKDREVSLLFDAPVSSFKPTSKIYG